MRYDEQGYPRIAGMLYTETRFTARKHQNGRWIIRRFLQPSNGFCPKLRAMWTRLCWLSATSTMIPGRRSTFRERRSLSQRLSWFLL